MESRHWTSPADIQLGTKMKSEYLVEGVAQDVDTLFRIRDQLVSVAFDEMKSRGLNPIDEYPLVDWYELQESGIKFSFRWVCNKV